MAGGDGGVFEREGAIQSSGECETAQWYRAQRPPPSAFRQGEPRAGLPQAAAPTQPGQYPQAIYHPRLLPVDPGELMAAPTVSSSVVGGERDGDRFCSMPVPALYARFCSVITVSEGLEFSGPKKTVRSLSE